MSKKLVSIALSLTTVVWLSGAAMAVPVAQAQSTTDLQSQIAALLAQIQQLQAQLNAAGGSTTTGTSVACSFTRSLTVGSTGADVKCLQQYLNASGFTIATTGAGSPGNESTYFGSLTKAAVAKWQAAKGVSPAVGYFGTISRAKYTEIASTTTTTGTTTTTTGTTTTTTTSVGSGLTVSLASTQPTAGLFGENFASRPFTNLTFRASSDGDVTVDEVTVERTGQGADQAFSGTVLLDENGVRIGDAKTFGSTHRARLTENFVIKAGQSRTITLAGDSDSDQNDYNGQLVSLSLVEVKTVGSTTVTASYPMTGTVHTVNSTLSIGTATLTRGPSDPGSGQTKEVGTTGYLFSALKVTAGSQEDITMKSVQFNQSGSAAETDLENVKIYVDGTAYNATVTGDYYQASLGNGIVITKGNSKEILVRGDIVGGSARTIDFDLYRYADVQLTGNTYGYGILPSASEVAASADDGKFHAAQPNFDAFEVTVSAGTLTVSKASSVQAQNIAINLSDQPLGGFEIDVKGEDVSVASMIFGLDIAVDGSPDASNITSITLVDANGNVVAGPDDGVSTGKVTFSDTVTFPVGKHIYTLKGKIGTSFSNDQTVSASTTPSGWSTVKGVTTGQTISPTPSSAVAASTMTIKGAALSISTSATPVAQSVVRGVTGFTFAKFVLDATGSGEDIRVNSMYPELSTLGTANTADDLTNCQMWDGSTSLNTGTNIANPTNNNAAGDDITVLFDTGLTISKGTTKTLDWKCDIAANGTGTTYAFGLENTAGRVVSTGFTSGQDVTENITDSNGQIMTMAGAGALTIALDSSSPSLKLVNANTTNNIISALKLTSSNEDISVSQISLQLTNTASNTPQDLVKVTGWLTGGTSAVGEAIFVGDYATMTLTGVTIPKNSDLVLTLKADIAQMGTDQPARPGHTVKVDFDTDDKTGSNSNTKGVGSSSGTTVYASGADTASNGVKIYKAVPTLAKVDLSSSERTLVAGTRTLYKFSVSAPSTGGVGLYKFTFDTASQGGDSAISYRTTSFKVYGYSDSSFSQTAFNTSGLLNNDGLAVSGAASTGEFEVRFNPVAETGSTAEAIQVPAGQTRYFKLVGDVTGKTATTTLSVNLLGDTYAINSAMTAGDDNFTGASAGAYAFATTATIIHSSEYNNFIWSDNATTTSGVSTYDWSNGYSVSGLPSAGMDSETLTP
ncbi:MAG: peptidoglycan-binding domain-containing protein [Candidatus Pacebacteria bacterium]|nr:peptidoglycan-binding domain-containing protein [Candidatus Paceibacterota bacterium]